MCKKIFSNYFRQGFSLIEILLVMAVMAIITAFASGYYRDYVKNVEFDLVSKNIISDLKSTQSKAMAGEDDLKWGVRFINSINDYYEIFSTPTNYGDPLRTTKMTNYLSGTIVFSNPIEGGTTDVIFDKIRGTSVNSAITIIFEGSSDTITVNSLGNIY